MEEAAETSGAGVASDELRSRLVELHARRPEGLGVVVRMTDASDWTARMEQVEGALEEFDRAIAARPPGDKKMPEDGPIAAGLSNHPDGAALYAVIRESTPGRLLFLTQPRLSRADPMLVGALARFADVKPALDGNLVSRDRVFTRIFEKAVKQPVLVDELLREDFARMAALPKRMFRQLSLVAADPGWSEQIERVEKQLESPTAASRDPLIAPAKALLKLAQPKGTDEARPVSVLVQPGAVRFSAMLREEVLAYARVKDLVPDAESLVKTKGGLSESDRHRTHAQRAMEMLAEQHPRVWLEVRLWLEVRIKAAEHYVELRSFLKLEALRLSWPGLTGYLSDRAALLALESFAQSGKAEEAALGRLASYRDDPRLMRFLRLRPWLKDMSPSQLKAYLAASAAVDAPSTAPALSPAPAPSSSAIDADATPPAEATFVAKADGTGVFVDLAVGVQHYTAAIAVDPAKELSAIPLEQWHDVQRVSMIGRTLFEWAFPEQLRKPLLQALKAQTRMRLWIQPSKEAVVNVPPRSGSAPPEMTDATLFNLPWEAMYVRELNGFLAAQGCSILRLYEAGRPSPPLVFDRPLRVLAVFSNPAATAPLNVGGEIEMLQRASAAAQDAGLVQVTVLGPEGVTRERLRQAIRAIRPQVFHFTGHGEYDQNEKEGALILGGQRDQLDLMFASQVGTLLSNNGVLLTVLNSCDTGTSANNAAVTGVAGTLVKQGIPAVVATLRQVADQAAIMFTRDFYSSLVEGESVEDAMYQTRTALALERQDWSVYGLYSSTHDLHRLVADIPRRRVAAVLPA
jgi:CHAT domain-containing protein